MARRYDMKIADSARLERSTFGFRLSKWYLDVVTEDGAVFIGYASILRWKAFTLHYSSVLTRIPSVGVHTITSLTSDLMPHWEGTSITWISHPLHVEAEWTALSKPIERLLFRNDTGEAVWRCLAPSALARVAVANGPVFEGLGYVERLELTVLPWHLPIDELRWGRFLAEGESLVWIDWKGTLPMTLLFHNSVEVGRSSILDTSVDSDPDRHLALEPEFVLRSGPLLSTTLSGIPGLTRLFPAKILKADECKWLSRGTLTVGTKPSISGWAIHEVVKFQ